MALSDKLLEIAEKVEVLEERLMALDDLKFENTSLRDENEWLRSVLDDFGINPDAYSSLADVLAVQKALQIARV